MANDNYSPSVNCFLQKQNAVESNGSAVTFPGPPSRRGSLVGQGSDRPSSGSAVTFPGVEGAVRPGPPPGHAHRSSISSQQAINIAPREGHSSIRGRFMGQDMRQMADQGLGRSPADSDRTAANSASVGSIESGRKGITSLPGSLSGLSQIGMSDNGSDPSRPSRTAENQLLDFQSPPHGSPESPEHVNRSSTSSPQTHGLRSQFDHLDVHSRRSSADNVESDCVGASSARNSKRASESPSRTSPKRQRFDNEE